MDSAVGKPHSIAISGDLDVTTVPDRLRQSTHWFTSGKQTVIDLGGVPRADSAGAALLVDWVRDAQVADASLQFVNAPHQLEAIIDFCGLGDIIPLSDD